VALDLEHTRRDAPTLAVERLVRILRYAAVGAAGTALHYGLMYLLLGALTPVVASTIGAAAGLVCNYALARMWVFAERDTLSYPFVKFVLVALGGIGVNAAILSLAVLSMPVWTAQVCATLCTFVAGYTLNDLWSFRAQEA
jgi:putative flippase GtrA